MPLKNRQQGIPGGFDWNEPKTGWTYRSDVFTTTRDAIIAHRISNPQHKLRTDPEHVEYEMEQRYEAKLRAMQGGEQWLILAPADSPPPVFRNPQSRGGAAGAKISNAKAGINAISSWLGSGLKPVAKELASARAAVCSNCPLNVDGNFWTRMAGEAGAAVKLLVEAKNEMKLTTPSDDKLLSCDACSCWLQTKVWVPIGHVASNTSVKVLAAMPEFCWVKKELQSSKAVS